MTPVQDLLADPRIEAAIAEMQALIRQHYPDATFDVSLGDDPVGVYLWATVDVEDRNDVIDVYIDRLVDLHVEEELPFHVIPVRPPERVAAMLRERGARSSATPAAVASS